LCDLLKDSGDLYADDVALIIFDVVTVIVIASLNQLEFMSQVLQVRGWLEADQKYDKTSNLYSVFVSPYLMKCLTRDLIKLFIYFIKFSL